MEVTNKNPFSSVPKVVIFDLCGTILNSKEIDHEAINYTLHKFNKEPWKITRQNKDPLKSMKDNFPNFFGKDSENAYNVYINYLIANVKNMELFKHTLENLRIINKIKAKTVIITNRDKVFIDSLKNNESFRKIEPFISLILSADEIGESKPSPKVVEYALNRLGNKKIPKSEIIMVGDALADMNTALSYKCVPILLTASTSDITSNFVSENYNRIYTANSHQEIAHCLIESYKRHRMYKKINTQEMYNGNSNRK